ncbi:MAG: FtsX-like permease family protein [Erysipelotrichaceae bacterium]
MKTFRKDVLREVKKSKGRFISIMLIVAIGVAFYTGVTTSAPVMRNNVDRYYDETNFRDFSLVSTMGFTDEDLVALRALEQVAGVYGSKSLDAMSKVGTRELEFKVESLPLDTSADNPDYINQYRLLDGRLPQSNDEAVVKVSSMMESLYAIGDEITLYLPKDDLSEQLTTTTFTVVGLVESPNSISYELGSTKLGDGRLDGVVGILDSNFTMEVYTETLVTIEGAKAYNSFDQAYLDFVSPMESVLDTFGSERAQIRFDEIKDEAYAKIQEGEDLYLENKALFEEGIASGKAELATQQQNLTNTLAMLEQQLSDAKTQFATAQTQLEQGLVTIDAALASVAQERANFLAGLPKLQANVATLQTQIASLDAQIAQTSDQATLEGLQAQRATLATQLTQLETTIAQTPAALDATEKNLNEQRAQMDTQKVSLAEKEQQTYAAIQSGKSQVVAGQIALDEARSVLLEQEQEGLIELKKASNELANAKAQLEALEEPSWYILSREKNYSFVDYRMATNQMESIAKVFPLFFILVAALVCLTTMTRMVDEQRGYIGTLKGLGYGKVAIASKYLIYAACASFLGSILGCVVGMNLFPYVIYNAWGMMYTLPSIVMTYDLQIAIVATIFFTFAIGGTTLYASYATLVETPATLMRPKAPTVGKRILLERIGFIWKRLSFTEKVTARNIFRYKKRFFMSVIGIAGCFALLLAGFGIRDSISGIVEKQFGVIQKYDGDVSIDSDATSKEIQTLYSQIAGLDGVEHSNLATIVQTNVVLNQKDSMVDLISLDSSFDYHMYFELADVQTKKLLTLQQDGVLISEKMAKTLGVKAGDQFSFEVDSKSYTVNISGVFVNYINHFMVMSDAYYEQIFNQIPDKTAILLNVSDPQLETALAEQINGLDQVSSVSFYSSIADSFNQTIESLNIVVLVLILSAGLLAFVVLYNLTNVNISERMREIATIKVLGFYDREVESYVYRENIVLTIIGSFAGVFLGVLMHRFIMSIVEQDSVIFDKQIQWMSYFYSFVITMFFSIMVNLSMRKALKEIEMVESLKSVE